MSIIATTDNLNTAGLIIWWTLRGDVDKDELDESLTAEAIDWLKAPPGPKPETALARALNEHRTAGRAHSRKRTLHRPLEGNKGRALVDETASANELDYTIRATAKVGGGSKLVIDTEDEALREAIEASYYSHLFARLSTNDISGWLSNKVVPHLDGLTLRDGGGFYFVPRHKVAEWESVVGALKPVSHHSFYSISAVHSDNAVEAILASVRGEAKALAEGAWAKLTEGKVGGRALENAAEQAASMREKVERYEALLGVSLTELQGTLTTLRATLAAAALKARDGSDYSAGLGGQDLSWADEV